jgi:hypothetical protein
MFDNIDAATFNNLFISRLDTSEGISKAAQAGGAFVRERLRELSFFSGILPPEYVTKADCQRSVNHDLLVKIVDIEPQSTAVAINFRGEGNDRYVDTDRYEIPFYKIESDKFSKSEGELLAYDYPVTKKIEENTVKDIQTVRDSNLIAACDAIVAVTGKSINVAGPATKSTLIAGMNQIDTDELATAVILMNKKDYNDWMDQPGTEIGSPLASEIVVNGYKYNQILGHKLIVTIKNAIVPAGTIWFFTEPKYLGNSFILNDTKFWIKKEADMIYWKSWEYFGGGIGNRRSVAKVVLT